ncbi:zinc ribbon domain-containing protein [Parabacteroides hominis]|uniref:Zinc ribbon domain-containing protein n=1 Tax=Parabacteroides hominis TaxID=2763057 RepID=A0ABR7DIY3_9BACT|nr:zinc ribbon domain-containing protein [Parabacteroides hominis]MBC5631333.1 zinc ribbon domain-containing protein [Parabacteroides hominis]
MTAREIFFKTLQFGWIKLGLGLLNIVIAVVLFAILMGISVLFNSEGVGAIMFFIWLGLIGVVNFFLNHYIGYLVKAGHVAVITMAFKTGQVPANPFETGKTMVKERFGTSNVYFALDKLVAGSVKQLQRALGRITDSLLGALPGADGVKSLTNMFLDISLGYIDECCLGYTFYNPEQSPYKSAADGVVIYAQNWKTLLKGAAKTAGTVILSFIAVLLVAFVIFGGLFRLFGWSGFMAFVISILLAYTVKYAFIDSWILVKMMSTYFQVVPTTYITFDLYGKLCKLSGKFKELFNKSNTEAQAPHASEAPVLETAGPAAGTGQPQFCPACGKPLVSGKLFCGNCGTRFG